MISKRKLQKYDILSNLISCIIHFCLVKQTLLLLRTKFNLKRFSHIGQLYDILPTLWFLLAINIRPTIMFC